MSPARLLLSTAASVARDLVRRLPQLGLVDVRAAVQLVTWSCVIATACALGLGALLLSVFRIGASCWHWRELGGVGLLVALGMAVWLTLPSCEGCGRRRVWQGKWCWCGQWLGDPRRAERWG